MKPRLSFSYCLVPSLIALFSINAQAKFAMGEAIPVNRLIRNVSEQKKRTPNDPVVLYRLGRLHSLAFASGNEPVNEHTIKSGFLKPNASLTKRKSEALAHLKTSLQLYLRAVKLKPNEALYWYSYGWMLDQGTPFAREVNAPFLIKSGKATKFAWQKEAFKAYRRAFDLSKDADLKREHILEGADVIVSFDAGQSILDLYKSRTLNATEREDKARIEAHLKKINALPHAVTPLIFPLNGQQRLVELTHNKIPVRFPLAGEPVARSWNWITPETGILVWDPKRTGSITSGKQLFGSVTWWIFWNNGFEPLAALDDNTNGLLEGTELAGIAVWQDKNGNGRSDTGEVVPIQKWGVKQIAVHATGTQEGVPSHPQGIKLQDGTTRPLYDWTPHSIPETSAVQK